MGNSCKGESIELPGEIMDESQVGVHPLISGFVFAAELTCDEFRVAVSVDVMYFEQVS